MHIFYALLSAAMAGVGAAMQKYGMATRFPSLSLRDFLSQWKTVLKTLVKNKIWLFGMILALSAGPIQAQALATGSLSVVQPLLSTINVWAILIGVFLFSERLTALEWVGVGATFVGAGVVSLGGGVLEVTSPDMSAMVWMTVLIAIVMIVGYVLMRHESVGFSPELSLSINSGMAFGLMNMYIKLATWDVQQNLGSFDVTSWASWSHMLSSLPFYMVIFWLVFSAIFLQAAFSHGRVVLVNPLVGVFGTMIPIVAAIRVFKESINMACGVGIALSLVGTGIMVWEAKGAPASTPH